MTVCGKSVVGWFMGSVCGKSVGVFVPPAQTGCLSSDSLAYKSCVLLHNFDWCMHPLTRTDDCASPKCCLMWVARLKALMSHRAGIFASG